MVNEQQQALWGRYLAFDRATLADKERADPEAMAVENALFTTYWRFVHWLARRLAGRRQDHDEVFSLALVTFLQAMSGWRPGQATFAQYAKLCVGRAIRRQQRRSLRAAAVTTADVEFTHPVKLDIFAIATADPDVSDTDLREIQKAIGLRGNQIQRARRKACANAEGDETPGEESALLAG